MKKRITHFTIYKGDASFVILFRIMLVIISYSIARLLFYLFNTDLFTDVSFPVLSKILYGGITFDLSAIAYTNALFIIAFAIPFNFRYNKLYQKIFDTIFIAVNGICIALNFTDIIYYRFILNRTTAVSIKEMGYENGLTGLILRYMVDYWYITLLWVIFMVAFVFLYFSFKPQKKQVKKPILRFVRNLAIFLTLLFFTIFSARGTYILSSRPINMSFAGEYVESPSQIPIVLNTPFAIIRTIKRNPFQEYSFIKDKNELDVLCNHLKIGSNKKFRSLNVMIIILESFGREYIGTFNPDLENGNYKGYAPFFDTLCTRSKTFCNSFANGRKSIDALPSIISGIPAFHSPYVLTPYVNNDITSLPNLLKEKGYTTAFFHGAHNGSMGFEAYTNLAGFDKYFGLNEYPDDSHYDGYWGIWDEDFFDFTVKEMSKMKQPFMTTIFTLSAHAPFDVPEKYKGKFPTGPKKIHETVGYSDYALSTFFKKAEKMPWFDSTLFVITADHASIPYYDGYCNEMGNFKIPILLYMKNSDFIGMDSTVAQQIDILPTVLSILNYDKDYFALGNNMLDTTIQHYAVSNNNGLDRFLIYMDDYMLLAQDTISKELYNFVSDHMMRNNVFNDSTSLVKKMEKQMRAVIQVFNKCMIHNALTEKNYKTLNENR